MKTKLKIRFEELEDSNNFADIKISYIPKLNSKGKSVTNMDVYSASSSIYTIELKRKSIKESCFSETFLEIRNNQGQNQALLNLNSGGITF
jgi:DNA-binding MltR family transcriptional regulator